MVHSVICALSGVVLQRTVRSHPRTGGVFAAHRPIVSASRLLRLGPELLGAASLVQRPVLGIDAVHLNDLGSSFSHTRNSALAFALSRGVLVEALEELGLAQI